MTWDMVLVTVTLVTVLLFIILLAIVARIWQDGTPDKPESSSQQARPLASRSLQIDKVTEQENLLA